MIDQNISWIDKINEIKKVCVSAQMPVDVEKDNNASGIDGILILGDMEPELIGDTYSSNWEVTLRYSISKEKWELIIKRLEILTQKLSTRTRFTFNGWVKIDDESKIIYEGSILIKGLFNSDVLS